MKHPILIPQLLYHVYIYVQTLINKSSISFSRHEYKYKCDPTYTSTLFIIHSVPEYTYTEEKE